MCPKMILIEQLGTSLPVNEQGTKNSFWVDVFRADTEFGKSNTSENTEELMAEPICYNGNIKIGIKTVSINAELTTAYTELEI